MMHDAAHPGCMCRGSMQLGIMFSSGCRGKCRNDVGLISAGVGLFPPLHVHGSLGQGQQPFRPLPSCMHSQLRAPFGAAGYWHCALSPM